MKIRSIDELETHIRKEFVWRKKELTNFYNIVFTSRDHTRNTMLKLLVMLLYSHWEGFIKLSAIAYCEYLNFKKIKYKDLSENFKAFCILSSYDGLLHTEFNSYIEIVKMIGNGLNINLDIKTDKYITTNSNLNSQVLKDIVQKLGFDYSQYELQKNLIDSNLLALRNAVAHGEYRDVAKDEEMIKNLYTEVNALIDCFKNQIINSASNESYLSQSEQSQVISSL